MYRFYALFKTYKKSQILHMLEESEISLFFASRQKRTMTDIRQKLRVQVVLLIFMNWEIHENPT